MTTNKDNYFYAYLNRCLPFLSRQGVEKLRGSTVAIAGCGGAGGASALTLARMGVSNFILADPGAVDEPDINRQWAANIPNLGKNKTIAYEETLRTINPDITVRRYPDGITDNNIEEFLQGADLVVDCLDIAVSAELQAKLHHQARKQNIYSLATLIIGFGAVYYCSSAQGMSMDKMVKMVGEGGEGAKFPKALRRIIMPQHLDIIDNRPDIHKVPSLPVSVMIAASFVATESILILLGKTVPGARMPLCLPKLVVMDCFRLTFYVADITTVPLE